MEKGSRGRNRKIRTGNNLREYFMETYKLSVFLF
jgi:hypothetical protein